MTKKIIFLTFLLLGFLTVGLFVKAEVSPFATLEKLRSALILQEELRVEHNEMGLKFIKKEITREDWKSYLNKNFNFRNKWLGWNIASKTEELEIKEENPSTTDQE